MAKKRPKPQKKKTPSLGAAQRLAENARKLRIAKFGTVTKACKASGFSIPRWYRLEQGTYPGMVGTVLDDLGKLFGVPPQDLLR